MLRAHGRVDRLLPVHGVVVTDDGAEIRFHRSSVVDGWFDRLQVGDTVDLVLADDDPATPARAVIPRARIKEGGVS